MLYLEGSALIKIEQHLKEAYIERKYTTFIKLGKGNRLMHIMQRLRRLLMLSGPSRAGLMKVA